MSYMPITKPELRGFGGDSLTKPRFKVTSAEVVIICPDYIPIIRIPYWRYDDLSSYCQNTLVNQTCIIIDILGPA